MLNSCVLVCFSHLQGRMLKMFVRMIRPRQILEIGTYSGYSALCLAEGLGEGGMLHTFEINDEQEDFTRPWLENSAYADKLNFILGLICCKIEINSSLSAG